MENKSGFTLPYKFEELFLALILMKLTTKTNALISLERSIYH